MNSNDAAAVRMGRLFDHFQERIDFLGELAAGGHLEEALLLCSCYIEAWGSDAFPDERRSRRRFVLIMREHGSADWLHLIHPVQLSKWLNGSRDSEVQALASRIRPNLERLHQEVFTEETLLEVLRPACSDGDLSLLADHLWGGSLAAVAYERLRNSAVHDVLSTDGVYFSSSRFNGGPIPDINFDVLHTELNSIVSSLRQLSIDSGKFCGYLERP